MFRCGSLSVSSDRVFFDFDGHCDVSLGGMEVEGRPAVSSELDDWEPMNDNWLAHYAAMSRHERRFNDFSGSTVRQLAVEVQRLRAEREALNTLHSPFVPDSEHPDFRTCESCGPFTIEWPCPTACLLQPKKGPS
jgi:hypothetical protein